MNIQDQFSDNISVSQMIHDSIGGCAKMQQLLYDSFAPKMYQVCLRYTSNNTDDAKDILQDAFIKVFNNLHTFRFTGSFEGWIRTTITRTALSHIRHNNKKVVTHSPSILHAVRNIEISVEDRLAEREIISMVKKLPPGFRKVFMLYVIEGYNHREIAALLNCTESTSKSQFYRSKTRLREILKKTA